MPALPPQSVSRSFLEVGLSELVPMGWLWTLPPPFLWWYWSFRVHVETAQWIEPGGTFLRVQQAYRCTVVNKAFDEACSPVLSTGARLGVLPLVMAQSFSISTASSSPWRKCGCPPWQLSSLELRFADEPWALFSRTESSWQRFV